MTASATTQLIYIDDHAERSACRLLVRWDQPRIRALVKALAAGTQLQEDQTMDLIASTGLMEATGDALDQWGSLVYEQRLGLDNTAYRQIILAKMLCAASDGTVESLLKVFATAAGPGAKAFHEHLAPASAYFWVVRPSFMGPLQYRRVARMMEGCSPAGRSLIFIEAIQGYFGYTPDDDAEGYDVGPYSRQVTTM